MYEMSQRHPVWVAENHVNPCNSVVGFTKEASYISFLLFRIRQTETIPLKLETSHGPNYTYLMTQSLYL
jgi:hypothetical protein